MKTKGYNRAIIVTCIAGVLVSVYALHVEMSIEANPVYEAMCDISQYASCSRVLSSEYAKGFGIISEESTFAIPNCIYGILFYCLIIFLATFDSRLVAQAKFFLALLSAAGSVYLAFLLAFVLYDVCVVCITTYVVNFMLLLFTYKKKITLNEKNK